MQPLVPTHLLPILSRYLDILDRWNQIHALTALPPAHRFEELIQDSAALLPFLEPMQPGQCIVDFGSGMGIPAVVLAVSRPDLKVVALDKSKKKMAFLSQVALELGLTNLSTIASRAEDLPSIQAALGTAKAVGSLPLLAGWWEHHGIPGAPLLALKGPEWTQEPPAPEGWKLAAISYTLPTRGERFVLHLQKK